MTSITANVVHQTGSKLFSYLELRELLQNLLCGVLLLLVLKKGTNLLANAGAKTLRGNQVAPKIRTEKLKGFAAFKSVL